MKSDLEAARDEQAYAGPRGKFIVMPSALSRFLLYNARPSERHAISGQSAAGQSSAIIGFKRLDPLSGITIGKRSPQQAMEFVNWEPVVFNRQYNNMHSMPRLFDFRWTPSDSAISSESFSSSPQESS